MKKSVILVLLSIVYSQIFSQNLLINKLDGNEISHTVETKKYDRTPIGLSLRDSAYYYFPDTITASWNLEFRKYFTYDVNNNLLEEICQILTSGGWEDNYQILNSFDASDHLNTSILQDWSGISWNNLLQIQYAYNTDNTCSSEIWQNWDSTYWKNSLQTFYTYNSNIQTGTISQDWNLNNWVDGNRSTNAFDANNNKINTLGENYSGGIWQFNSQNLYNYDSSNNCITEVSQSWNGSTWINIRKDSYAYDANNNQITDIYQDWNSSTWMNRGQMQNFFNNNNYRIGYKIQSWDTLTNSYVNYDSAHYFYHEVSTGVENIQNNEDPFIVYPNPSQDNTTMLFSNEQKDLKIRIFDVQGKSVSSTLFCGNKYILQKGSLKPGIYFIQTISKKDSVRNQKLIIQ